MPRFNTPFGCALSLTALSLMSLSADSLILILSADTAIYGDAGRTDSNAGLSPQLPSGGRGSMIDGDPVRILIKSDLASQLPTGSRITDASLSLHVARIPGGGAQAATFGLHRMLVPWIEGRALAGNPGAGDVQNGEPTWNNRAHPDTPWGTPGGEPGVDFTAIAVTTRLFPGTSTAGNRVAFNFTAAGIAELQAMLDDPSTNHGWMLKADAENEATPKTARLFTSKDNLTQDAVALANRPSLSVTFTPPAASPPSDATITFPTNGTPTLSFTRDAGVAYEVESTSTLSPMDWTLFSSVPASSPGGLESIPVTSPFPARLFFRISVN